VERTERETKIRVPEYITRHPFIIMESRLTVNRISAYYSQSGKVRARTRHITGSNG